jgi:hypothetical protein
MFHGALVPQVRPLLAHLGEFLRLGQGGAVEDLCVMVQSSPHSPANPYAFAFSAARASSW